MANKNSIVSKNWLGHKLGIDSLMITDLGSFKTTKYDIKDNINYIEKNDKKAMGFVRRPLELNIKYSRQSFIYADYKEKKQYRVSFNSEQMAKLRTILPDKTRPQKASLDRKEIQKLIEIDSDFASIQGQDSRIRIERTNVFPNSAIVALGNHGTGAMISDRVVLTAAHVISRGGYCKEPGYEIIWNDLNPAIPGLSRDVTCSSGDDNENCKVTPFGETGVSAALIPEGWFTPQGKCSGGFYKYNPYHFVDDIAVIFLDEPIGQETGFFDIRPKSTEEILNAALIPNPSSPDAPAGSELWEMWGMGSYFFAENFLGEVDGVYKLFTHNGDTSPGHSGSPIYQLSISLNGGWRPEIVGIVSHQTGSMNVARRVGGTDTILDFAISLHMV